MGVGAYVYRDEIGHILNSKYGISLNNNVQLAW